MSVRYQMNQWLYPGLWVHTAAHTRTTQHWSQALLPAVLTKSDFSRAEALLWGPSVLCTCLLKPPKHVPSSSGSSSWLIDTIATLMAFSIFLLSFLPASQLTDTLSFSVRLLACTPTTPVAISPAFQQCYHPLQIVRKLSCLKVCNRERTMHKQTEIPWLHWNPYSCFHSFWWAHCLWQRNLLSSALSGY